MWSIAEITGGFTANATIVLKKYNFGKGLPFGKVDERYFGYKFFEKSKHGKQDDSSMITCNITDKEGQNQLELFPVLYAVTNEQFKNWKSKNIKAVPVTFSWKEMTKILTV